MTLPETTIEPAAPAWNLAWLSPIRCRIILVLVLGFGAFSHVRYLTIDCPMDLSGDEAQYWDWSRNLDLSYYSKGPLVAYIIRFSCAIFGDTMPAVRYPAIALGVGTSLITYLLTRKLFGSERLALGAVLLFHLVPLFIAGSLLMTIDPPMFFCWAVATYFATIAIFDDRKWAWVLVGIAIGLGFLAKYAALLWFVGLFGFVLSQRRHFGPALLAAAISLLFTIPVLAWNALNDWVSFRHVATQTGASAGAFSLRNPLELIGSQLGVVGPTLSILMIAAIIRAISQRDDVRHSRVMLLLWLGLPFWILNLLTSFRTKVQPNWPAPAYFTLMILTAWFLGTRLQSRQAWRPWRGWFYATLVIGVIAMPILHDTSILFPLTRRVMGPKYDLVRVDLLAKLRGWKELGREVSLELRSLPPGAFVVASDYQQTALMAFYVEGQPKTYCAGSYLGSRLSQYDMWTDRRLDAGSPRIGRDAVYVSRGPEVPKEFEQAFERLENAERFEVVAGGETIRVYHVRRCFGFKGLRRSEDARGY